MRCDREAAMSDDLTTGGETHNRGMAGEVEGDPRVERVGDTHIQTFLIAEVRGYTLFTQQRGDEAAGKLAGKFARIARDVVEARGGTLLELRGDEALCVFVSPRQAIRAAVELQVRFVEETIADPELPLTVGIGIDAGRSPPSPAARSPRNFAYSPAA
jgi:class 3 adenylate cyclase